MNTMFGGAVVFVAGSCAAGEHPPDKSAYSASSSASQTGFRSRSIEMADLAGDQDCAAFKTVGSDLTFQVAIVGFGSVRMSSDVALVSNAGKYTRKEAGLIGEADQELEPNS